MKTLVWVASLALSTSLSACGGGGGGSDATPVVVTPPPPGGSVAAPGVYDVNFGQFKGVYTFLSDGSFHGLHFINGGELAGHPHGPLSAANSVSARESIAWANFVDDVNKVGRQESTGVFGRTFNAASVDVSITGSMGTFKATTSSQKLQFAGSTKTLYNDPIALSVLAGAYQGSVRTVGINQQEQAVTGFTIDATGGFAVTVKECVYTGTLVQHGSTGIFDLQASTSGAACTMSPSLKGIVMPLSMLNNTPQLSFLLDSADNAKTAVFIVTKN